MGPMQTKQTTAPAESQARDLHAARAVAVEVAAVAVHPVAVVHQQHHRH